MKRILLSLLMIGIAFATYAQDRHVSTSSVPNVKLQANDKPVPVLKPSAGDEILPLKQINQYVVNHSATRNASVTPIGVTTYDLMSNAAIDDRMFTNSTGAAAVWTFSVANSLAAPDRGSGYNFNNGTAWGAAPSVRVESERIGWPSIGVTANGAEHIVAHRSGTNEMWYSTRPAMGSGAWTQTMLPATPGGVFNLWPRLAIGGNDGNSLHMIDITTPTPNGGVVYQGMDGAITYTRSEDAGVTWNLVHVGVPGADSTEYAGGMGADAYSIDANGQTIAITSGAIDIDWAVWKSTDNGDTWTKTLALDFPFENYDDLNSITDINNDGIADTVLTVDGKVEVLVDNNGMVHAWAGSMFIFDGVIYDPLSLFLSTDGLLYWNESFGPDSVQVIAQAPDLDLNGTLDFALDYVPRYGNGGQTTQPSAGIDASGNIVVSYVTLMENTTSGNPTPCDYSFRNNWMMATADNGATWEPPFNVGNSAFDECVYPSVSRSILNNCVDVIWQQDGLPGIAVQDDGCSPFGNNDIIHDCVDITLLGLQVGINEIEAVKLNINLYPNPVSDKLRIDFKLEKDAGIQFEILNAIGQVVKTIVSNSYSAGSHTIDLDVSAWSTGMYFVNATIGESNKSIKFVIN